MFNRIIHYSIHNKLVIALLVLLLVGVGIDSLRHLPLDAVPDITDNQVQIITSSPDLSAQEVERLVTYPLEMEMANIPDVIQVRSISRFGLSVITIVFEESVDIYWGREQINQKLIKARSQIPVEYGEPEMGPISTGLGEIYQYVIYPADGYENRYNATDLRTIQDWIIKRQIIGIPGVVEVNSSGGYVKQYEISLNQTNLKAFQISVGDIFQAVEANNANSGGSYIEKENQTFFIRGEGMVEETSDLENIVVATHEGMPVLLRHVAEVTIGHAPRFGAVTMDGKGEVVAGQVMMLKGENSMEITHRVKDRIEEIKATLPEGIVLEPYLDRSKLVDRTTHTVSKNLIEGALIVIFILVLLLGNLRAGLIVASVIPISMLFAVTMMRVFGVSANLMSLGALDFGLIVDGAVIIVEAILHHLGKIPKGSMTHAEREQEVFRSASNIRKSAAFGEIIILIVYLPIFFLQGVEGKMFIPMAQTVSFAILGALILSLTYVPMMSALFLKNASVPENSISNRIMAFLQRLYVPVREFCFSIKYAVLLIAFLLFVVSIWVLSKMGSEFIPTLEEGDFALHQILPPGSSIKKGVEVSAELQNILKNNFPEVEKVVTKIGTAEIPTDIMPLEAGDIYVIMKPKDEWVSADNREDMFEKMEEKLNEYPGVMYEFTQPIQMRFNELMTGIRQDIAIKIYGEDLGLLIQKANQAESILQGIDGVGDIQVEPTAGLQQMVVAYDRAKLAKYGVSIQHLNTILKSSFAGKKAGTFYEGERKFDIVVRLRNSERQDLESLRDLHVNLPGGGYVPMAELASIDFEEGPTQISRDDTKRRITIGVNARNIDIATLINSIRDRFSEDLNLPAGYYVRYGGQFENLERARGRLMVVVPLSLLLIFVLLYMTFGKVKYALLIFSAIPLSAIGGIWALFLRGMPFSISAGVGFIALFGVAVLNGIVLVGYFNQLKREGHMDIMERIRIGTKTRLRPVVMTAAVASLGFLPMALSRSAGAEVQQPLATVVIGGLITATFLTLIILPILYFLFERPVGTVNAKGVMSLLLVAGFFTNISAQNTTTLEGVLDRFKNRENGLSRALALQTESFAIKQKSPVLANPLQWSVSTEEFQFGREGVHSLNFQKTWKSRGLKQSYEKRFQASTSMIQNQFKKDSLLLLRDLVSAYLDAAYYTSLLQLNEERLDILQEFSSLIEERVRLGADPGIAQRQIQLELEHALTKQTRLERDANNQNEWVSAWLGGENAISATPLEDVGWQPRMIALEEHPNLGYFIAQQEQLNAQHQININQARPQLFTGMQLQSVDGNFLFFGLQAGMQMQLGNNYRDREKEAFQLQSQSLIEQQNFYQSYLEQYFQIQENKRLSIELRIEDLDALIAEQTVLLEDLRYLFSQGQVTYNDVIIAYKSFLELKTEKIDLLRERLTRYNEVVHFVK